MVKKYIHIFLYISHRLSCPRGYFSQKIAGLHAGIHVAIEVNIYLITLHCCKTTVTIMSNFISFNCLKGISNTRL